MSVDYLVAAVPDRLDRGFLAEIMQVPHASPCVQQRILPRYGEDRQSERDVKNLVIGVAADRFDKSDIVVDMLEHINAQQRVEVDVFVQHVGVDVVYAGTFALSRQLEGLTGHFIANEGAFGQESFELHQYLACAAANFCNPGGIEIVSAKGAAYLVGLPG